MRRGHGSPPVLGEVPHELSTVAHSKECKRSPQQFIPAGFPLHNQLPTGMEDSVISLTTPDMVRSGRVLQPQLNLHLESRNNRTAQTIIYRKYVVAATRFPSPLRLETISARNGPCPVPRKPLPESSVPGETLPGEVGGINCGGDMGVRRCLARFLTSLALRCALQRVQTVPAAIHSGRIPPPRPTSHGDGRLREPPHHTGHGPFRTRPPNLS